MGRISNLLASKSLVGTVATLAFLLSFVQLVWPLARDRLSNYSITLDSPDLVNLFCEGSEGIDVEASQRPICNGNNPVVFMATPLFYNNTGWGDKTIWLRREIVDVIFLDGSERPVKEIALAWERVASSDKWHAPGVEQIETNKAISHSTLFYPESFGCSKEVTPSVCQDKNSYKWSDFADQVINHNITHAEFTFKPNMIPHNLKLATKCRWIFTDGDIADLKKWRDQYEQVKSLNPKRAADPAVTSPPYALLSANCEPLNLSQ